MTGSETTIRRVTAETNYSCLMLKTQRFSSLFRHYAKYHGLRKDDLEYYFTNLLENEDTPESVQLQRGDTIMVRKRRLPEPPSQAAANDEEFCADMMDLLNDEEHMDCTLLVHPSSTSAGASYPTSSSRSAVTKRKILLDSSDDEEEDLDAVDALADAKKKASSVSKSSTDQAKKTDSSDTSSNMIAIRAHKSVLTARAEYFKAVFRKGHRNSNGGSGGGAFAESESSTVQVEDGFSEATVRSALEFLYTNRLSNLLTATTEELVELLHLADLWLLRDLKRLLEQELVRTHLTVATCARLYGVTETARAQRLARACIEFIMHNLRALAGTDQFEEEMKQYPHLCIPVLKAAADLIPDAGLASSAAAAAAAAAAASSGGPAHKKQRTSSHSSSTPEERAAAARAAALAAENAADGGGGGGGGRHRRRSSPVPDSDA